MRWLRLCYPAVLNPKTSPTIKQMFRAHKRVTTSLTEKLSLSFPNFRNGSLSILDKIDFSNIKAEKSKK